MNAFMIAFNAILPFVLYISYGYIARVTHLVQEDFFRKWSKVCFTLFFPFVMFHSFYEIDRSMKVDFLFLGFSFTFLLLLILVLCLIVPKLEKDPRRIPVIEQAIFRSNAVLFALPMSQNVFGDAATPYCAMLLAIVVPTYNIAAVIIFEHAKGEHSSIGHLLLNVLKNPMVIGALVGLFFLVTGIRLPAAVEQPASALSAAATPTALLILGGTLHFASISRNRKYIAAVTIVKLIFVPALVIAFSLLLRFNPVERFVVFAVFATPVATSSFPMAAAMGGDGALAGELVVISTVISVFTLFLWIFGMSAAGLI